MWQKLGEHRLFAHGGVSVLNRWLYEICISFQSPLTVNYNGTTSTASGDQSATGKALAEGLNTKMKAVIVQKMRQGELIWNAQQGRA
jgi:hypothetical protein